jgi:hypothetical protein
MCEDNHMKNAQREEDEQSHQLAGNCCGCLNLPAPVQNANEKMISC